MEIQKDIEALALFIVEHGRKPQWVEMVLKNGFRSRRMREAGINGPNKLLVRLAQDYLEVTQ